MFTPEQIAEILKQYDEREAHIKQQLEYFASRATTPEGQREYKTMQRAYAREIQQMNRRRAFLVKLIQ